MVELLIVVAIIAIFMSVIVALLDPIRQLEKARDALRKHDAVEIKNALDAYYNDHSCYPASVPFGGQWKEGSAIYMAKVPQDPDYPNKSYVYKTNTAETCPQWGVIFSNLSEAVDSSTVCPLVGLPNCLPTNYESTFACSSLGVVDCDYIGANSVDFPTPTPRITSTPTPTPTSTPTPTPTSTSTPTPTSACSKDYACTGNPRRCNNLGIGSNIGQYCASNCNGVCQ